jgi:molybdenum cofactor cytidylyltransferase
MNLSQALRNSQSSVKDRKSIIAFVGSGGKTTSLFQLAHQLPPPVIVTTTTHLHVNQVRQADSHRVVIIPDDLADFEDNLQGVMLVTGPIQKDRVLSLPNGLLSRLREICCSHNLTLLIEADGSRNKPIKAPANHEPVIPDFVEMVVVVAGLTGIGKKLSEAVVHRPEIFARLSGLRMGATISSQALSRVLAHPAGGLKNIPPLSHRVVLLNQADSPELQTKAKSMAEKLLSTYHTVIIASLEQFQIHAVYEPIAGIILAAGGSSRFGRPKPLLDWHGKAFVRAVAETALSAGLSPVLVVTGAAAEQVETVLHDLPVAIEHNSHWQQGQSTSIQAGLIRLAQLQQFSGYHTQPGSFLQGPSPLSLEIGASGEWVGSAIFMLADQPQITTYILNALTKEHARTLAPIVAPLVGGTRANPVLFDRETFLDLLALRGDIGGKAIFCKYQVDYLPWHDENLLSDVDTPEDYRKLVNGE